MVDLGKREIAGRIILPGSLPEQRRQAFRQ
jgi:hypothetical protein